MTLCSAASGFRWGNRWNWQGMAEHEAIAVQRSGAWHVHDLWCSEFV